MRVFDNPEINDNREYDYSNDFESVRGEYEYIVGMMPEGKRVIDLGCGNGSLMQMLRKKRNAAVEGIELSASGVEACRKKGLSAIQGRIDEPLNIKDDSFDYAVCNVTIQMVAAPEILLSEMKRIARYQIVSFPNFAFYKNRIELLLKGSMPEYMLYGYSWYNTGHIHQLSIRDYNQLLQNTGGLKIVKHDFIRSGNSIKDKLMEIFPNLFQTIAIILTERTDD